MARKWHVNPVTGNPGQCKAFFKCKFQDQSEHFDTEEEARKAYEKISESVGHKALSKRVHVSLPRVVSPATTVSAESEEARRQAIFDADKPNRSWKTYRALETYSGEETSAKINGMLAESIARESIDPNDLKVYDETVNELDQFIAANAERSPVPVFRGAAFETMLEYSTALARYEKLEPGEVIFSEGFTSTSLRYGKALDFGRNGAKVITEIVDSFGAYTDNLAAEVLLPRNAKLAFVGKEVDKDSETIYVKLRQL
jgi:hypothetical protein